MHQFVRPIRNRPVLGLLAALAVTGFLAPQATAKPVRFVVLGDQGTGNWKQKLVAKAMVDFQKDNPYDFVVGVGDNFYPFGLHIHNRAKRFKNFESIYRDVNVRRFYMTLGNHDYYGRWKYQIRYTFCRKRMRWCTKWNRHRWYMPKNYYTFKEGPVQFFALDTPRIDPVPWIKGRALGGGREMMAWFEQELAKSQAQWKVVFGHHPMFSYGGHGKEIGAVRKRVLRRLVKYRVDLHLSGHEHSMQFLRTNTHNKHRGLENIDFVVSGTGAKGDVYLTNRRLNRPGPTGPYTKFSSRALGFTYVVIDGNKITVQFVGADKNGRARILHTASRTKNPRWVYRTPRQGVIRATKPTTRRASYQMHRDTFFSGPTIRRLRPRAKGQAGCEAACTADARCRVYTYRPRKDMCILKSAAKRRQRAKHNISGVKR